MTLTETTRNIQGCKIQTTLDVAKLTTNRLTSICGKYYTVITLNGEMLEFVGKRSFDKWAVSNDYKTDF